MLCYACGNELSEQDYCTACGADVGRYKKIIYMSCRLYNEGLDKARVRDLTGAVVCLKQSIKLYRKNIDARNLLGLVYYELGEVTEALVEWVISSNQREEKNLAVDLLARVQSERQSLETLGRTARKYNLALGYAEQESYDLAVIQLKRILQINPRYVRARKLLALLYLRAGDHERVRIECNRCLQIDNGDTLARRYLREAQNALMPADQQTRRRNERGPQRVVIGNETVIRPPKPSISEGLIPVGTAVAGAALGIAACWFLIMPTRIDSVQQAARQEITAVSEESDAKSVRIKNLEQETSVLTQQINSMEAEAAVVEEKVDSPVGNALMRAITAYLRDPDDIPSVRECMMNVSSDSPELKENEIVRRLYDEFMSIAGGEIAESCYQEGIAAYQNDDDTAAILMLKKAVEFDPESEEALYYLASAYERDGRLEEARDAYERVISEFPESSHAKDAQNALAELNSNEV